MKALKLTTLKTILTLILIAVVFPACAQSDNKPEKETENQPTFEIQTAVVSGDLETVKKYIAAGHDLNLKEPFNGSTPLITAATFGKIDIAKALIDAGADLSITNKDGSTALHSAAFFCRVEIVQMLIDANADKSIRNNFGATARESVMGPFAQVEPIYNMMQQQLSPMGFQLDMAEIEKTRPVISMMLQ